MADTKLTEKQVADLAALLRSDAALDTKVQSVTVVKSGIKQHNVPEACVAQLFDALRAAATAQHAVLVNAGLTALNHLLTRLSRQEPKLLAREAPHTLPVVIDKLGDHKDKFRSLATQALHTLYAVAPADVEQSVRGSAMVGKNPRAKEAAMSWLLQAHKEQGLQFRGYVPLLMELLEDADGMVRDSAKTTVIELFKNAPNAAKSDLKRQLKNFKVRPAIEQSIVKELAPSSLSRPATPSDSAPRPASRAALGASVASTSSDRPITPLPDPSLDPVDPIYVNTQRELDDIFKEMAWSFEGKETEQNWPKRERNITKLRKLNAGNTPADFRDAFLNGLRAMLDGILKTVNSLRTSLSKEGCSLVQEIAVTFGPAIDPMVELLMQTLIKLSAGTKKISSQLASTTVDIILGRVSYSSRLMQHVWGACQDKNVQPRSYASGWLKTLIKKEARHKSHVEHTGGLDLMEKCIRKGLGDANPSVRERMRSTFWAFHGVWPQRADAIMAELDSTAQRLLARDPSNPNSPRKTDVPRPGPSLSKSTSGKPSLRETVMAQKKATMAARNLPPRPGSAMAHISPMRTASNSSNRPGAAKAPHAAARPRHEAHTVSVQAGGMSSAPMRPVRRRPERAELIARPATAGPYSSRDEPVSMEAESPDTFKSKLAAPPRPMDEVTPKKTTVRPRPGHTSHASESSVASPRAQLATRDVASPRVSPRVPPHLSPQMTPGKVSRQFHAAESPASPSRGSEDATLVVPSVDSLKQPSSPQGRQQGRQESGAASNSQPASSELVPEAAASEAAVEVPDISPGSQKETPSQPLKVFEDPFVEDLATAATKPSFTGSVLEDRPVNEAAASLQRSQGRTAESEAQVLESPEKSRQNSRLLDSGINKIRAKTLEVHGFRKLQSLIRDSKTVFGDGKLEALVIGLFQYLEDPLEGITPHKAQDIKTQILATIKLALGKDKDSFRPYVSVGLECLLETRAAYDSRAHIVSALELLADDLVAIGDGPDIIAVLTSRLQSCNDTTADGCRMLSMGLHVLGEMLERRPNLLPTEAELAQLAVLAGRCLNSSDSGVRMDAVQLCVTLHGRVADTAFWAALQGIKDDPKSLITYYIVKKQREHSVAT